MKSYDIVFGQVMRKHVGWVREGEALSEDSFPRVRNAAVDVEWALTDAYSTVQYSIQIYVYSTVVQYSICIQAMHNNKSMSAVVQFHGSGLEVTSK